MEYDRDRERDDRDLGLVDLTRDLDSDLDLARDRDADRELLTCDRDLDPDDLTGDREDLTRDLDLDLEDLTCDRELDLEDLTCDLDDFARDRDLDLDLDRERERDLRDDGDRDHVWLRLFSTTGCGITLTGDFSLGGDLLFSGLSFGGESLTASRSTVGLTLVSVCLSPLRSEDSNLAARDVDGPICPSLRHLSIFEISLNFCLKFSNSVSSSFRLIFMERISVSSPDEMVCLESLEDVGSSQISSKASVALLFMWMSYCCLKRLFSFCIFGSRSEGELIYFLLSFSGNFSIMSLYLSGLRRAGE